MSTCAPAERNTWAIPIPVVVTYGVVTAAVAIASVGYGYTAYTSYQRWKKKKENDKDLSSPTELLSKLQAVTSKLGEEASTEIWSLYPWIRISCAVAALHLFEEIQATQPDYRNKLYKKALDASDDIDEDEAKELVEVLEYADWAYMDDTLELRQNLKTCGYELFRHDKYTDPGRVANFVAFDHTKKVMLVALKGTSSLEDILTDVVVLPKEHKGCAFDDDYVKSDMKGDIFCHEGMYEAATLVANDIQGVIESLILPQKYKVLICGHSLGAGTATLLGVLLRDRIPAFRKNTTDLRVLAYATPAVLSFEASKACSKFITSVVNNADCVPRLSLGNINVMEKLLLKVKERLAEKNRLPSSAAGLKAFLEDVSKVDDELLLSTEELDAFFDETLSERNVKQDGLFVPGRVVAVWNSGAGTKESPVEVESMGTNCTMQMLRQIEVCETFVSDHFTASYRSSLAKLLEQVQNSI